MDDRPDDRSDGMAESRVRPGAGPRQAFLQSGQGRRQGGSGTRNHRLPDLTIRGDAARASGSPSRRNAEEHRY